MKKILPLILLLVGVLAARAQTPEKNKRAAIALYEAFNKADYNSLDKYIAADANDHALPAGLKGLAGVKEMFKTFKTWFPDGTNIVEEVIAEGDYVVGRVRFTGTNAGPIMNMPATNKKVDVMTIDVIRFDKAGKAVEHWGFNNDLAMMQQLGLAPADPPLPMVSTMSTAGAVKSMQTAPEQNKKTAAAFYDRFTSGDFDGCLALLAPTFKVYFNGISTSLNADTYRSIGESYLKAFPDLKYTPIVQVAERDRVVTLGAYTGTQTNQLMTILPTNRSISIPHVSFDRIENGRIAERYELGDQLGMLQQLGVIQMDQSQAKK